MFTNNTLNSWSSRRRELGLYILLFTIVAFSLRFYAAILFPSVERPDEIYQNLEPAYRLWTGDGVITWEWRSGIRSWFFPGILATIMYLTDVMHLSNDAAIPLVWATMSVVSCGTVASGVWVGWKWFGTTGAVISGLLTTLWPDLIYFGPKTLGEVQSGHFLVVAAALSSASSARRAKVQFGIGVLLGFAFDLRFQLILPIFIVLIYSLKHTTKSNFFYCLIGLFIPVLILGFVDWWTLGLPLQSVWKNIQVNLIANKAAEYGITPIYGYINLLVSRNGPAIIPLFILFLRGFTIVPLFGLLSTVVIIFHSIIPHKEISFIYAALPCAMIVVSIGASKFLVEIPNLFRKALSEKHLSIIAILLCVAISGSLAMSERPFVMSARATAVQALVNDVRVKRDLCGLAVTGWFGSIPWTEVGGYVSLRRKIPIYLLSSVDTFLETENSFNYAIGPLSNASILVGFNIDHCTRDYCLYHQNIRCQTNLDHEISRELIRRNQ